VPWFQATPNEGLGFEPSRKDLICNVQGMLRDPAPAREARCIVDMKTAEKSSFVNTQSANWPLTCGNAVPEVGLELHSGP
jgi:hypothetical protein